ncbi:MAG TPA: tripartite tricarboxylate transporter substrate binding protein [Ramlibacter sp.]|uniref:tripartite tricarboxylate transporter substrate binding protein n=1 Tax=Ramlibacter sp. TaxID=1917967 RepID=UPI002D7FD37A|nr:tripartite tricarboxylate transporter substrate binding protein [Ramlibacter sp.]HET8744142.1 tripartite tricarboxylate transporter substrate binding protein [Ramlibacter sp.]
MNSATKIQWAAWCHVRDTAARIRAGMGMALAAGTVCLAPAAASAADFPQGPVEMIVPFASGGGLDQNARAFGKAFSEALNTPVAVVNRDGAAGAIGLAALAGARADGQTLAFTPAVSLTSQPHRVKTIKYGLDSFTPVCHVFDNIFAVAVLANSPYRSISDILAKVRAEPESVSYGTSGIGSIPHLGTADIEAAMNVRLNHVAYKGDGPMMQDLLGGRLGFGAVLASSVAGQVQAGTLRLLAVYSDHRHPAFPSVPTLREAGVPVVQLSFGGVLAPAKTPPAVLEKLQAGCERAVKSPAYVEWAAKAGQVIEYQPAEAFARKLREDSRSKEVTIKRLGL